VSALGTVDVALANLSLTPPGGFAPLALAGERTDIPMEERQLSHMKDASLTASELKLPGSPDLLEKPSWELAPGESIALDFKIVLDWPPGEYDLKLHFRCDPVTTETEARVVAGRARIGPVPLTVTGAAKPED
jgi:hypothetical protein